MYSPFAGSQKRKNATSATSLSASGGAGEAANGLATTRFRAEEFEA